VFVFSKVVTVHGTLKLENRNWKFGLYTFVLFMNDADFSFPFMEESCIMIVMGHQVVRREEAGNL